MTDLFNKCIRVILKNEGGYVNHPSDPGGETNFGIAKRFFPDEDIKNLTVERAKELYYLRYWKPMNLEGIISEEIVLHIFDFGINAGRGRAIKKAQKLCGIAADGICGPITIKSINNYPYSFLEAYKEARREYYIRLAEMKPQLKVFLKGWLNRVNHTNL